MTAKKEKDASKMLVPTLVDALEPEKNPRFQRRILPGNSTESTWCNVFSDQVAAAYDPAAALPHRADNFPMLANEMVQWFPSTAARKIGYLEVDAKQAKEHADRDGLGFVIRANPKGPGHVAPLLPNLETDEVMIANVGASNFARGPVAKAFGATDPPGTHRRFFVWRPSK